MRQRQMERMRNAKGFIAALDQSGGSTPGALAHYGVESTRYGTEEEMFEQMHRMRARVIRSPAFSSKRILGAILFAGTMRREIEKIPTAQYLWQMKGVVPFLKVDQGMEEEQEGVRLMKPMPGLDELLAEAYAQGVFGTKMRSFIARPDSRGIRRVVEQQFACAAHIAQAGLVPIIEPEVDIHCGEKTVAEELLLKALMDMLGGLPKGSRLLFKLTLPTVPDLYAPLMASPKVVRVLALSGGYTREEADRQLAMNHGVIASFSRALLEDLRESQTEKAFNAALEEAIREIYHASLL